MCGCLSGSFSKMLVKRRWIIRFRPRRSRPSSACRETTAPLWKPVERSLLAELAARSKVRVAKDAKFAEIIKNNKEAAGKKGVIRLADLRKEMEKEGGGKKKETPTELKQKARDQYAPFVNESVNVLLDMVMLGSAQSVPQDLHAEAGGMPETLNKEAYRRTQFVSKRVKKIVDIKERLAYSLSPLTASSYQNSISSDNFPVIDQYATIRTN